MRFAPLLLLFLTLLSAASTDLILKDHYSYEDEKVFASDLFPQISDDFEVLTIPPHLQHFNIAKQRIFDLFKRHGVTLAGQPHGLVHFRRQLRLDLSALKERLHSYYMKQLPFLTINKVYIRPKSTIQALPKHFEIEFKKQLYKNNRGTIKITGGGQRIFFTFQLDATYSQFTATQTLHKGDPITSLNTKMEIVPFKHFHEPIIGYAELGQVEARRYIKEGKPIRKKDVQPVALVKRGGIVNVKLIEGNILIHFSATALKDGRIGETIFVKKDDGTRLKVKVVGQNKVEIE